MIEDIAIKIAAIVLSEHHGRGSWETYKDYETPEDCIIGLSVGDVVYSYDPDEQLLEESVVCAVFDGVGYVAHFSRFRGPVLTAVDENSYSLTRRDAIDNYREEILEDIRFTEKYSKTLLSLRKLLEE